MGFSNKNIEVRKWDVYKITNPVGRVYIGVTSRFKDRMAHYKKASNPSQTLVMRSIKKYGFDVHKIEVIDTLLCNTTEALSKEMFWIRTFMSNKSKYPKQNGMNLTDGGEGTLGYKMTKEQIASMSIRNKGYRHTDEAKKKISEASKRNNIGKKVSEATKEKLRQANLGKKYSEDTKRKLSEIRKGKHINRIFSDEEKNKLSLMRKGKSHTQAAKFKISERSKGNEYPKGRPIKQISLNGLEIRTYKSISEAYRDLSITKNDISRNLKNGTSNKSLNCYFKYI